MALQSYQHESDAVTKAWPAFGLRAIPF